MNKVFMRRDANGNGRREVFLELNVKRERGICQNSFRVTQTFSLLLSHYAKSITTQLFRGKTHKICFFGKVFSVDISPEDNNLISFVNNTKIEDNTVQKNF